MRSNGHHQTSLYSLTSSQDTIVFPSIITTEESRSAYLDRWTKPKKPFHTTARNTKGSVYYETNHTVLGHLRRQRETNVMRKDQYLPLR